MALGTATLLQLLQAGPKGVSVPRITIEDSPHSAYRGLLVDVARSRHGIDTLKQCVELCRLYKIRYLQLHLTDGQAWKLVGDRRTNTDPSTPQGDTFAFGAGPARYVRVNLLRNSANPAVHLVELMVHEAKKE